MSVIAGIAASPRKEKNSEALLEYFMKTVKTENPKLETKSFSLAGKNFSGCISCDYCRSHFGCSQKDDLYPILEELKDENIKGLVLVSPVYMGGMTSQAKAFLDRTVLFRRNGFAFQDKIAGAVAIGGSRNGGQDLVLQNIHAAFMIHDMLVAQDCGPTSHFGGVAWERVPGGVMSDADSLDTTANLAKKMVAMVDKFHS